MIQLAAEPIGKESEASTADVGRMLNNLPRRAAFVRSGDDVAVIYTHTTPTRLDSQAFPDRLNTIKRQTRAKYCHPREEAEQAIIAEVDAALAPVQVSQDALSSGWEEA